MHRVIPISLAVLAMMSGLAFADPSVRVNYVDGTPQVELEGSYAGSYYVVYRGDSPDAMNRAVTNDHLLCLGSCFAQDSEAIPGHTYYYRFVLSPPQGNTVSFGPYAVLIPENPVRAHLSPNPSRGFTRITLSLPGSVRESPVRADVRILDLQGRTVRVLQAGPLPRGTSALTWDGRSDRGQELGAGVFFLRLTSPLGGLTTRITRLR